MRHEFKLDPTKWAATNTQHVNVENLPQEFCIYSTHYQYCDEDKHYWSVIKISIYKNNNLLLNLFRNYSSLADVIYVEQNLRRYLVTSIDYQCITVIDLDAGTAENYTDEAAYKNGRGFCPINFDYDQDEGTLDVTGCFWGAPIALLRFYRVDFSNFEESMTRQGYIELEPEDEEEDNDEAD